MKQKIPLKKGDRFHKWCVIDATSVRLGKDHYAVLVECECGARQYCAPHALRDGKTRSCRGCREYKLIYTTVPSKYFTDLRHGAKIRNIKFEISHQDAVLLFERQQGKCALTNRPIEFENHTASLDRIDSSLGYTPTNIQWIHKNVNIMKRDISQEEFIQICREISNHANN